MLWEIPEDILVLVVGMAMGYFFGRASRVAPRVSELPPPAADDRFERLLRALPLPVVAVNRAARVTYANALAGGLFGFDPQRYLGRAMIEAVRSVDVEELTRRAIGGEIVTSEIVFARPSDERTLAVSASPLGEGAVLIAVDRTQLVALESVRREFVSNVSHELRTPLSAIKLMIETVLLAPDDPEVAEMFLPKVSQEVDRMVQLVADLLDIVRSESGQMTLRKTLFDLRALVASTLSTFVQRAQALEIALRLHDGEAVEVEADANRLTQVIVNLVDNALRHTPVGGAIDVILRRDGTDATITVRDSGVGIPYNDLPHIFERFYVVDRSRARESGGTGLGLSIVKQIVEAHGGTVVAESQLGAGAAFTARLPILIERPAFPVNDEITSG